MTFSDIRDDIAARTNQTSNAALARIGTAINRKYREVTSSVGLNITRRTQVQATMTPGSSTLTFTGIEKITNVLDKSSGSDRVLQERSMEQMRTLGASSPSNPTFYGIALIAAHAVTIQLD